MKKEYTKPAMEVHDIKMTQMLCYSGYPYPGQFGYVPGLTGEGSDHLA